MTRVIVLLLIILYIIIGSSLGGLYYYLMCKEDNEDEDKECLPMLMGFFWIGIAPMVFAMYFAKKKAESERWEKK